MITKGKLLLTFLIVIASLFTSCKSDDDSPTNGENVRQVRYEISGNFSGSLLVAYDKPNGMGMLDSIPSLPWSTTVTYNEGLNNLGFGGGSYEEGNPNETVNVRIFSASNQIINETFTAGSTGILVIEGIIIRFPE